MTFQHIVTEAQDGWLLYTLLKRVYRLSASLRQTLKATGGVTVESASRHMNQRVKAGETIEVQLPEEPPTDAPAESGALRILYEDEALLALEKPPGMLVHPSLSQHCGTLLGRALGYLQETKQPPVLHPIHRLDRDTGGIVLFARHGFVQAHLMNQMRQGEIEKEYRAIACGVFEKREGEIDLPIGHDPDNPLLRRIDLTGKPALTHYVVLEESETIETPLTLLRLRPISGRTHQLRVHCAAMGAPLLGDLQYANEASKEASLRLGFQGQCLHAETLCFLHPLRGKE